MVRIFVCVCSEKNGVIHKSVKIGLIFLTVVLEQVDAATPANAILSAAKAFKYQSSFIFLLD